MTDNSISRIKELESKSIFHEDSIERLSKEVRLQQIEIIKLKEDLRQLIYLLQESETCDDKPGEKPPHY